MEVHTSPTSPSSAGSFLGVLELACELAHLNPNKVKGLDGIYSRVLRELLGVFSGSLTDLFNQFNR